MKVRTHIIGVCAIAASAVLATGGAAVAASGGTGHTVTYTQVLHTTTNFSDYNPCAPADTVDIVSTDNAVMHFTVFPASDEAWGTFTDEGSFTATDTTTTVVYSGHSTFWGNFNINKQNSNSTFTGTIIARGDDGSTIRSHETAHVTMNAQGVVTVTFDKPSVSCG